MVFSFFSSRRRNAAQLNAAGDAARDARNWDAAIAAYSKALEIVPQNAGIWVQKGHALKEGGKLVEAESCYRRALEIKPREADTYTQLGHVLKLQSRTPEMVEAYLQSYKLDPSAPNARQELRACGWTTSDLAFMVDGAPDQGPVGANRTRLNGFAVVQDDDGDALKVPEGYAEVFTDVSALERLGLVSSPLQHFLHYGYRQGRDIVMSLAKTPPSRVFVLCPSFFKRCGIGEHARYLANCVEAAGYDTRRIRSTRELERYTPEELRDAVLIVNHGPGLFDGYNPELSEGETTTDLLTTLYAQYRLHNLRPVIFMHSLLDKDNEVMFPRQQLALEFPIPVVTTIEAAARTFNIFKVEHGMQPMEVPQLPDVPLAEGRLRDRPVIGFFGFYQWGGKNFDALFNTAERLKAKLVGSVATREQAHIDELHGQLKTRGIHCDIGTGWVEDVELARRLAEADFHYLPQHDYDHWNNSGTARFVMNFGRPVMVPPHNPFLDLRDFVLFSEEHDMPAMVAWMRDEAEYEKACARIRAYGERHPMLKEMPRLANDLVKVAIETGVNHFLSGNTFCSYVLLGLTPENLIARLEYLFPERKDTFGAVGAPESKERAAFLAGLRAEQPERFGQDFPVAQPIQYWRDHYELEDFLYPDVSELIVASYRMVLKREVSFIEMRSARQLLRGLNPATTGINARQVLTLIARLISQRIDLDCAPNVQIYHHGKALGPSDMKAEDLTGALDASLRQRADLMTTFFVFETPVFSSLTDQNLFQILTLRHDWVDAALTSAASRRGLCVQFQGIGGMATLMERYVAVSDTLARAGLKPTDVFLMDAPIASPIDTARRIYSIGEFLALEGDTFIVALTRALLKRDPTTQEMFVLADVMNRHGLLAAMKKLDAHPLASAHFIDASDASVRAQFEALRAELDILVNQMRSPHAGGWQLRNDYLEAKRHYDRLWLRLKRNKDVWWAQSGADFAAIISE